jgi:hypothetical protein
MGSIKRPVLYKQRAKNRGKNMIDIIIHREKEGCLANDIPRL